MYALLFLAGLFTWTFMEYALHHWLFHLGRGKNLGSREHLEHHARPWYFSPIWLKTALSLPVLAVIFAAAAALTSQATASFFTAGIGAGWTVYEWLHYRLHLSPPRTRYGRWMRRNHFHHHFVAPKTNHGVTVPLWDRVFGTHVRVTERIPVPAKLAHSLAWVLGADGEIDPRYAAEYRLVR